MNNVSQWVIEHQTEMETQIKNAQARSQKINWNQQKNIINDLKSQQQKQQAYQSHVSKHKLSINK